MNFPKVEEKPIYWGRLGRKICPDNKAVVDTYTGRVFAVTTNKYNILRHEDVLDVVHEAIARNPEFGNASLTLELPDDGAKMWAKYVFPETEYDIGDGDLINPTIEVRNSYDTGWAFSLIFGAFRLVCSNGLVVGKKFTHYVHRHTHGLNKKIIFQVLNEGMEKFSEEVELWKKWVDKVTTSTEYEQVMETMNFYKKEEEEIHQEVEISSNLSLDDLHLRTLTYWTFYNLIAQYITHRIQNVIRRAEFTARMARAFYQ